MSNIYNDFLNKVKISKNKGRATVVFLNGDLGSGKTTFVKNMCKHLELDIDITSPTFTILKRYMFEIEGFKNLIHIDTYRLNSYSDLLKIKFEEYLENQNNLILIEWPSVISDSGMVADININFSHGENIEDRSIVIM